MIGASIGISLGTILISTLGMAMIDGTTDDDRRLRVFMALTVVFAVVGGYLGGAA